MTKAIYAGSFDPITNGHLWVIERAMQLFDEVIIAVGLNPQKKSWFSVETRLMLLHQVLANYRNITIEVLDGKFLVHFAAQIEAKFIIRGIRNTQDYEYEKAMCHINKDVCSEINTVFLMPPRDYSEVSSSLIRGLVGTTGWEKIVDKYVPYAVLTYLETITC